MQGFFLSVYVLFFYSTNRTNSRSIEQPFYRTSVRGHPIYARAWLHKKSTNGSLYKNSRGETRKYPHAIFAQGYAKEITQITCVPNGSAENHVYEPSNANAHHDETNGKDYDSIVFFIEHGNYLGSYLVLRSCRCTGNPARITSQTRA